MPLERRPAEARRHRVPREARHPGRARRAHRGARARIAPLVGADPDAGQARRAARQGRPRHRDGRRVPRTAGPDGPLLRRGAGRGPGRRAAIEEHYKPLGPTDRVPTDPVSVAVALADKLDMLTGFWAIDEKPTGSKDPYALRRAALGVVRLAVDCSLRLSLTQAFAFAHLGRSLTPDESSYFKRRHNEGHPKPTHDFEYFQKCGYPRVKLWGFGRWQRKSSHLFCRSP